jgi:hypothetical protein
MLKFLIEKICPSTQLSLIYSRHSQSTVELYGPLLYSKNLQLNPTLTYMNQVPIVISYVFKTYLISSNNIFTLHLGLQGSLFSLHLLTKIFYASLISPECTCEPITFSLIFASSYLVKRTIFMPSNRPQLLPPLFFPFYRTC